MLVASAAILAFISLFLFWNAPTYVDGMYMTYCFAAAAAAAAVFLGHMRRHQRPINWADPSILFFVAFLIVHLQNYFTHWIGWPGSFDFFFDRHGPVICKSLALSVVGLSGFVLGHVLFDPGRRRFAEGRHYPPDHPFFRKGTALLTLASYLSYGLFLFTVGGFYLSGRYAGSLYWGSGATYAFSLFNLSLTSLLILRILHVRSMAFSSIALLDYIRAIGIWPTVIVAVHAGFSLFVGDRGPVISSLLLYFGYYVINYYRVGFAKFVVVLLAFAFLLTIIGLTRSRYDDGRYLERIITALDVFSETRHPGIDSLRVTSELANSARCVQYSVESVPSQSYAHAMGRYQLLSLLAIIPGGGTAYKSLTGTPEHLMSTSGFITYLEYGLSPLAGSGTTVVADFYLDFGVIGVLGGMFVVGLFFRRMSYDLVGLRGSLLMVCIQLVFFAQAIYLARSAFLFIFKTAVLAFLVLKLVEILVSPGTSTCSEREEAVNS